MFKIQSMYFFQLMTRITLWVIQMLPCSTDHGIRDAGRLLDLLERLLVRRDLLLLLLALHRLLLIGRQVVLLDARPLGLIYTREILMLGDCLTAWCTDHTCIVTDISVHVVGSLMLFNDSIGCLSLEFSGHVVFCFVQKAPWPKFFSYNLNRCC